MCLKESDFNAIQKGSTVIQVDFKFYLVEELPTYAEEIDRSAIALNHYLKLENCFEVGFIEDGLFGRKRKIKEDIKDALFLEINLLGCTRIVFKKMNFDYNLNFKQYLKEKKEFIKLNPDFEFQVNNLFNENVTNLTNFFLCSEKQLLKINTAHFIKRLEFNIKNKILQNDKRRF
jgi:hypothetical protein